MVQTRPLFVHFSHFHRQILNKFGFNGRMVDADESTEQWLYPNTNNVFVYICLLDIKQTSPRHVRGSSLPSA